MTAHIAPVTCADTHRTSFASPVGSYYMVGTPSVRLVLELIQARTVRVVFSARQPGKDWIKAEKLLVDAGIEICSHWKND